MPLDALQDALPTWTSYDCSTTGTQAHSVQLYAFQDSQIDSVDSAVAPCRLSDNDRTRMELSLAITEQETHAGRLAIQQEVCSGKGTDSAYLQHLRNYEKFTEKDQVRCLAEDSTWKVLPPHPITVVKAATFLEYETKRPKVNSFLISALSFGP